MKLSVITPVGPGHEHHVPDVRQSVEEAWEIGHGPFTSIEHHVMFDPAGLCGRSRVRNMAMDEHPADWHFLLDADDRLHPKALKYVDTKVAATFGFICLRYPSGRRQLAHWNVPNPVTRETLFEVGAKGTLSMGCFVRGDLGLRFNEDMDVAEDFDFYMRLPSFTKVGAILVRIGYDQLSASGPRSSGACDWIGECNKVIDSYRGC